MLIHFLCFKNSESNFILKFLKIFFFFEWGNKSHSSQGYSTIIAKKLRRSNNFWITAQKKRKSSGRLLLLFLLKNIINTPHQHGFNYFDFFFNM